MVNVRFPIRLLGAFIFPVLGIGATSQAHGTVSLKPATQIEVSDKYVEILLSASSLVSTQTPIAATYHDPWAPLPCSNHIEQRMVC
jgi:hypothetical protein